MKLFLFINDLSNKAVSRSELIAPNGRMFINNELERIRKETVMA